MARLELKDYLRESRQFTARAVVAAILVVALLAVVVSRLVHLQVISHEHFTTLSRDNRVKVLPLPPTRGLIYDRNGILLAGNRPAYSLEITPEQVTDLDTTLAALGQVIDISEADVERFNKLRRRQRRFDSIPIRSNLSPEETARFAVQQHRFPGVAIKARLLRYYPYGKLTAHVLGYVGRISQSDIDKRDLSEYAGTSHIGKTGLERTYEKILHGRVGLQNTEVNAVGRRVRVLEHQEPVPGRDLHLHLDIRLQAIARAAFGERNGSLVAVNVRNGGVLALVSKPGFDPNPFVEGISVKAFRALQGDPSKPLFNRALRGQYPPGSTVKPFIGLGGLETHVITSQQTHFCPGYYQLPNSDHKYRDWKKTGHGRVDLDKAITQSCDVYFYQLAHDMGIDRLHDYLGYFNFGQRTGIDLVGELPGLLPSREWKRRNKREPWYPGETLILGIGQGYFLSTPLQLAAATAALANDGSFLSPRMVASISEREGRHVEPVIATVRPIPITSQPDWDDVHDAMLHVVEGPRGTARLIRSKDYRIAGKTGTAQVFTVKQDEEYEEEKVSLKNRDHALFIAYAPADDPDIAVAVIVENGGHGSSAAAPIAKQVMDAYLLGDPPQ